MKTGRVVDEVAGEEPGWSSRTGKIERAAEPAAVPVADAAKLKECQEQQLGLLRQRPQLLEVAGDLVDLEHVHPALNTPQQRAALVLAEVAAEPAVQHRADRRQMVRQVLADAVRALAASLIAR